MTGGATHLHDLPEVLLLNIFSLVSDVRSRNAVSLVSRRWRSLERSTRSSLSLRGNARDIFLLPTCFPSVTDLDLSLLSPWGHPLPPDHQALLALRLRHAFPHLSSLTLYARHPTALAPHWPALSHLALVRWHQRPHHPPGSDLFPLLAACPTLSSLDLSRFYCWTEDIPAALKSYPLSAASLRKLNLLNPAASEGFRSAELRAIASACPNLTHLLVPCIFNPRYLDFVGDDTLLSLAASCPNLSLLHLVDLGAATAAFAVEASITNSGLERFFAALPRLEDLAIESCHHVSDAGKALEMLRVKSLRLGSFTGVCRASGLHLDGVAVCGSLESLSIKNCSDLADAGLVAIARGCRRLSKFAIHGCDNVTEIGIKRMAGMLRSTLVDVSISSCGHLTTPAALRALEPIRDRIEWLHIDCAWVSPGVEQLSGSSEEMGIDEFEEEVELDVELSKKKCRYSDNALHTSNGGAGNGFWCRVWERLRYLSLLVPVGELISPLADAGLEMCPQLEEISIKVEGDSRNCQCPHSFGLSYLACYPRLSKMKLDCGDAIGYALTAPTGRVDLSTWERCYLNGIEDLNLNQLDYWPPQDRDVNQRSVSLPATSLIQRCVSLRKLFIHGTMHEHFLGFFLNMPNLRDVQLREDYYPAPENDMSTEMRVSSCSRFEDALNNRLIDD